MARLNVGNGGINMTDNSVTYGRLTSISPNAFEFSGDDGSRSVITGSFSIVNGQITGGTMQSYTSYFSNGQLNAQAINISISLASYDSFVSRGDVKGFYQSIFAGNDIFSGGAGKDVFIETPGNDIVNGGDGTDTIVFDAGRSSYQIIRTGATEFQVTRNGATTAYSQIERVVFGDGAAFALDADGAAGQAYRVYQAAFNRTPDKPGLSYWINAMDNGASLIDVAQGFVNSAEFKNLYGAAPTQTELVNQFYQNVLGRQGETAGVNYWVSELASGRQNVAQVLAGFSESTENQARIIGSIQDGIPYTPFW